MLNDLTLIDEPVKPVRILAIRIMKMIPDVVNVICHAFLGERIGIKVSDGHGVGVKSPKWNVFLFQGIVYSLLAFIYEYSALN